MHEGAALTVPERMREREDLRLARSQQLLARELRAGVQVERLPRQSVPTSSVAKACRCVSLPGDDLQAAGLDLDEALALEPGRGRPILSGYAPAARAGGRHGDAVATRGRARSWAVDLDEWKSVADGAKLGYHRS